MTLRPRRLLRNEAGNASLEFAFAAPVLIVLMIGALQMGIVMHATGEMRHAVGEGIRFAKVGRLTATTGADRETQEALVKQTVAAHYSGVTTADVKTVAWATGVDTANNAPWVEITLTYQVQPVIPFVNMGLLTMTQQKRAYLPA